MKHSPGPWVVTDDGDYLWVAPPDPQKAIICDIVGRVFDPLAGCSQLVAEDEANARLIAAAPELLEAVRMFMEAANDCKEPTFNELVKVERLLKRIDG